VREVNAALARANAALQEANADLEQFAYSASHDLQEPLRMVVIYSELLRRRFGGKLGETGDEYLTHTVQGALRMEALLQGLRIYMQSFITDGEPQGDLDAGAVLDESLANLAVAIAESGAQISRTALPCVRMYHFQLQQIFQNLIGNAIRYRGEDPPRICISAEEREQEWLFSVQDNGIGIDARYHEQIFEVFRRLHSANEYPGAGMGLAICKRIIERCGGRIWVKSERGRGSTFSFTLPK
jgi:light-regulated signal transduction histidine kinase (bacteriophytochrome)